MELWTYGWYSKADVLIENILVAARTEENSTLWMIDYRIKRGHHVPTEEQAAEMVEWPPSIFYGGSGRKYVAVKKGCYPYKSSDGVEDLE
jgi:hypothetical protein